VLDFWCSLQKPIHDSLNLDVVHFRHLNAQAHGFAHRKSLIRKARIKPFPVGLGPFWLVLCLLRIFRQIGLDSRR